MMIDLKMSKTQKNREFGAMVPTKSENLPSYPYWASLHLSPEDVKKLDLDKREAGEMIRAEVSIKVTSVNIQDQGKGKKIDGMTLQIQKIEFMTEEDANKKMRKEVAKEVFQ